MLSITRDGVTQFFTVHLLSFLCWQQQWHHCFTCSCQMVIIYKSNITELCFSFDIYNCINSLMHHFTIFKYLLLSLLLTVYCTSCTLVHHIYVSEIRKSKLLTVTPVTKIGTYNYKKRLMTTRHGLPLTVNSRSTYVSLENSSKQFPLIDISSNNVNKYLLMD